MSFLREPSAKHRFSVSSAASASVRSKLLSSTRCRSFLVTWPTKSGSRLSRDTRKSARALGKVRW
jgi:hypothetical protein